MALTSQDLIERSQALVKPLADLCAEMLRRDPVEIVNRTVMDVRPHFDALLKCFTVSIDRLEEKPSFPSAIVVATIGVAIHERALEIASWPSPSYQKFLREFNRGVRAVVASGPAALATLMRRIEFSYGKIDDVKRQADAGASFTIALEQGGVVLTAPDGEAFRFWKLILPSHTCGTAATLSGGQRVTVTGVEFGDVAFTTGCGCNYIATDGYVPGGHGVNQDTESC